MNAKEFLMQISIMDAQIQNKKLELEAIEYQMSGCKAISYEPKEGVGSASTKSPQEKFINRYLEYEKEIQKDIDNLVAHKKEAMFYIDQIKDANCVDILYKRYFQRMKWEEIAVSKNYSYRGILKLHGKALQEFGKVFTKVHIDT